MDADFDVLKHFAVSVPKPCTRRRDKFQARYGQRSRYCGAMTARPQRAQIDEYGKATQGASLQNVLAFTQTRSAASLGLKTDFEHCPVLLNEAVDALVQRTNGFYIDGTFGRGGHSRAILARLEVGGRLMAFDKDPEACAAAHSITDMRFEIVRSNCASLREHLAQRNIYRVSGVLLDLGVSSPQLENPVRGFSFNSDGPLDMRMDPTQGETAADWLARASQQEIAQVIHQYGEERFARTIAKTIVARRAQSDRYGPIARTCELAELVARIVKTRPLGHHPATRTFQAIRIHINQELEALSAALQAALEVLEIGGRLVVISFHSLEDRIVKRFMQRYARPPRLNAALRSLPLRASDEPAPLLRLASHVRASSAEVRENVRARSAVMRIAEKVR